MAMFEQMRANVGKLLKGIDRSEPGRRERFCSGGMEERVFWESRGWSGACACRGVGFPVIWGMFRETAL